MLSYRLENLHYIGYNIGGKKSEIISNGTSIIQSIDYGPCDVMYGQHNIGTLKLHYLNYLNKVCNFLLHPSCLTIFAGPPSALHPLFLLFSAIHSVFTSTLHPQQSFTL